MTGVPSGRFDLNTRGASPEHTARDGRGGFEMNVVSSPALASTVASAADGLLCLEGPCLTGWAWVIVALTLLSAAIVQCWHPGGDTIGGGFHPFRVSASPVTADGRALLLPRLPGVAAQTGAPSARPA